LRTFIVPSQDSTVLVYTVISFNRMLAVNAEFRL